MDFDSVLNEIGTFGKFQIINYFLMCLPVFFSALNSLSYVFTAGQQKYRYLWGFVRNDLSQLIFVCVDVRFQSAIQLIQSTLENRGFTVRCQKCSMLMVSQLSRDASDMQSIRVNKILLGNKRAHRECSPPKELSVTDSYSTQVNIRLYKM